MQKHRLFIGIEIDADVRTAFARVAERLHEQFTRLRLVETDNYHLTLVFLGNVMDDAIAPIEASLDRIASRHRRFSITFERLGAFPHERKPRIIYVGCRGASAEYRSLAQDANSEMQALGYGNERDDVPHVTLARAVERKRFTLSMLDVPATRSTVEALTLFESVPCGGKTRYEARARVRLAP